MNDGLEVILNGIDIKFHPIAVIFNKRTMLMAADVLAPESTMLLL
jgi:hypothetical protein